MSCLFERVIDTMDSHAGWTALGNDTLNKADSTTRVRGTGAVTFDKVNGLANTIYAGVYKTVTAINLEDGIDPWNEVCWYTYVPDIADVAYSILRLGTAAGNYVEYRYDDSLMASAQYVFCHVPLYQFAASAGTACPFSAVTYIAVGVAFDLETDARAGIIIDHISIQPAAIYTA